MDADSLDFSGMAIDSSSDDDDDDDDSNAGCDIQPAAPKDQQHKPRQLTELTFQHVSEAMCQALEAAGTVASVARLSVATGVPRATLRLSALSSLLRACATQRLSALHVSTRDLSDSHLRLIASECPQLRDLSARSQVGTITDAGVVAVAQACRGLHKLSIVLPAFTPTWTDEGLVEVAMRLKELRYLHLWSNRGVTDAGFRRAVAALSPSLHTFILQVSCCCCGCCRNCERTMSSPLLCVLQDAAELSEQALVDGIVKLQQVTTFHCKCFAGGPTLAAPSLQRVLKQHRGLTHLAVDVACPPSDATYQQLVQRFPQSFG